MVEVDTDVVAVEPSPAMRDRFEKTVVEPPAASDRISDRVG